MEWFFTAVGNRGVELWLEEEDQLLLPFEGFGCLTETGLTGCLGVY